MTKEKKKEEEPSAEELEKSVVKTNPEPSTPKPNLATQESTTEITPEPNQESYPGVPADVLEELKSKYRMIFGSYFNEKPALYRILTTKDYLDYQEEALVLSNKLQDANNVLDPKKRLPDQEIAEMISKEADELLVSKFTVYPEDILKKVESGEYPGGCIYSLTQAILVNSGFADLEPLLLTKEDVENDEEVIPSIEKELLVTLSDMNGTELRKLINEHGEILLVWALNNLYIVRGFNYNEYSEIRRLSSTLDPAHLSIELISRFLLYPNELSVEDIPAGLVLKVLSDGILSISGFTNTNPDIVIME
jgi:hypothetical protein